MELKSQLDTYSAQLQQGLKDRNVDACMVAIQQLKALGANVTFSLAPEEQQAMGYDYQGGQYPQGDAGQYQGGGQGYQYPPQ